MIPDTAAHVTRRVARRGAWMSPDARRMALLYITNANARTVFVYSYPKGTMEGELTGFKEPYGVCSDKAGDIWIVDDETQRSPNTRTAARADRTLNDPGEYPAGCSVDPATGNLAVTNFETFSRGPGSVSIYKKAKGKPKLYSDAAISRRWYCSYDDRGDLFVDGYQSVAAAFSWRSYRTGALLYEYRCRSDDRGCRRRSMGRQVRSRRGRKRPGERRHISV